MSTRVKVTKLIAAPLERVVEEVSDFTSLGAWHPAVEELTVEGAGVGAIRKYRVGDARFEERLQDLAEDHRGYRYQQVRGPFPVESCEGYLWIGREGEATRVDWSVKLRGAALPDAVLVPMIEGMLAAGLTAVKAARE